MKRKLDNGVAKADKFVDNDNQQPKEKRQRTQQQPIFIDDGNEQTHDDSDDEAKELAMAIQLSLQQQAHQPNKQSPKNGATASVPATASSSSSSSASLASKQQHSNLKFKGDRFYLNKLPTATAADHTISIEEVIEVVRIAAICLLLHHFTFLIKHYFAFYQHRTRLKAAFSALTHLILFFSNSCFAMPLKSLYLVQSHTRAPVLHWQSTILKVKKSQVEL